MLTQDIESSSGVSAVPEVRPLFARFGLAGVPYISLGSFPTPVRFSPEITRAGSQSAVWVKEDSLSAVPYGGNKVRKLELLLARALAQGARSVWTAGGLGSHHALATAIYASRAGLQVEVQHFPQPTSVHVRTNCLAVAATGAKLRLHPVIHLPAAIRREALRGRLDRSRFPIVPGGSTPLGTLGYVNAALEIDAQIRAGDLPEPHTVFVPVGTGGTLAGLILGFRLARRRIRLVGVVVIDKLFVRPARIRKLVRAAARLLLREGVAVSTRLAKRDYELDHDHFGGTYGEPTDAGRSAVALAEAAGFKLENTYTGKALAAVISDEASRGKAVLFINTFNAHPVEHLAQSFCALDLPRAYHRFFEGAPSI